MSAASAATTSTPAAAAVAATTTAGAAAASAGKHRVVDYKPYLSTKVLHEIYGRFFEERNAVRIHQQVDAI